jgi:hypothetical protein
MFTPTPNSFDFVILAFQQYYKIYNTGYNQRNEFIRLISRVKSIHPFIHLIIYNWILNQDAPSLQ